MRRAGWRRMREVLAALLLILAFAAPAGAASQAASEYKPIILEPDYDHDRFVTQPKAIVRIFRGYLTSLDPPFGPDGDPLVLGIPRFVAYEMRKYPGALGKCPDRPSPWITDKNLAGMGIAPYDASYVYSKSFRDSHPNWYVRGHLAMKQHACRLGPNADWNTHTLLNAVPQRDVFNRKIWQDLENKTAAWADRHGRVWIIAGPVFRDRKPSAWLGEKEKGELLVAIPDLLFKIVVRESASPQRPDVLAFLYSQEDEGYGGPAYDHRKYLVSVREIEEKTGLNFFTLLSKEDQDAIESRKADRLWE